MIEARYNEILESKGPRTGLDGAKAQAHQAMRTLRAVLNFAMVKYENSEGQPIIHINPVKRLTEIRAWKKIPRRQSVIKFHQLKPWAKAVMKLDNTTVRDYILLLLFTGLRRGEAAGLKWNEVDFEERAIHIPGDRTKNKQPHSFPMSDFVYSLLKRREKVQSIDHPDCVFPGEGKSGHLEEPKRQIQQVINQCGVKFSSHDLRRTFLSAARKLRIDVDDQKELVNHSTQDVTSGYWVLDYVEELREPLNKITKFITQQSGLKPFVVKRLPSRNSVRRSQSRTV